jgi:hypothetical protein
MKPIPPSARVLLPLTFLVMGVAPTGAETLRCRPIAAVPYTITTPGAYCLARDLSFSASSSTAISIQASNVLLDFNGHRLAGPATVGPANSNGISAANGVVNLTIRNGTVQGFLCGIYLGAGWNTDAYRGHVIEQMRVIDSYGIGILAAGRGTVIRDNQIVGIGTSTGLPSWGGQAGIFVLGAGTRVLDNDITKIVKSGTVGDSVGILLDVTKDALVERNRITEADIGISFNAGGNTGKYRDNLTSSVTTPYSGTGIDAGNNH